MLAPSAFLASAAGTSHITQALLPPMTLSTMRPQEEEALRLWKSCSGSVNPPKRHGIDQLLWPLPPVSYPRHQPLPEPTCLLPNKKRWVLGSLLHLSLPWACKWTTTAFVWQSASACPLHPALLCSMWCTSG